MTKEKEVPKTPENEKSAHDREMEKVDPRLEKSAVPGGYGYYRKSDAF